MVWKIFAPRLIYEIVTFAVVAIVAVFIYTFCLRVAWLFERESASKRGEKKTL